MLEFCQTACEWVRLFLADGLLADHAAQEPTPLRRLSLHCSYLRHTNQLVAVM